MYLLIFLLAPSLCQPVNEYDENLKLSCTFSDNGKIYEDEITFYSGKPIGSAKYYYKGLKEPLSDAGPWHMHEKMYSMRAYVKPMSRRKELGDVFYHIYRSNGFSKKYLTRRQAEDAEIMYTGACEKYVPPRTIFYNLKLKNRKPLNLASSALIICINTDN